MRTFLILQMGRELLIFWIYKLSLNIQPIQSTFPNEIKIGPEQKSQFCDTSNILEKRTESIVSILLIQFYTLKLLSDHERGGAPIKKFLGVKSFQTW